MVAFAGPGIRRDWRFRSTVGTLANEQATVEARRDASQDLLSFGEAAIPSLTELLRDENVEIRGIAATALKELAVVEQISLPRETMDSLLQAANRQEERQLRYDPGSEPYRTLVLIGTPSVPLWIQALESDDADVRLQAMEALAAIGPGAQEAVPVLLDQLTNRVFNRQEAALDSVDWMISSDASAALASIGRPAIPGLAVALTDKREWVRFDAGSALSRIGLEAVPELIKALNHPELVVQLESARSLSRMGREASMAIAPLKKKRETTEADSALFMLVSEALANIQADIESDS